MPSESKPLLAAQTEKPNHYSYLKEFRVEQCPLFLQHKCTQHRPFTCFHWHFMNQRRRRPVRKRDGTYNYSADTYCTKYDETTGICPDGDDCPLLHRTAGDTERRYHLRYYKTCMCVHDTDSRGFCVKNGQHCAFAHGTQDHRPPVYDIKEIQALETPEPEGGPSNGPNALDKERNLMNEDPKWADTNHVLSNYKTDPCKRPPRLCRQGYACPQYHNSKDKRRSPRKYKYRSTPCPSVKHGEEWGEPGNCEAGDQCTYCHTRTEQQFHPEIYKSTKCNDVQQAGYCPRGVFCAFAHVEQEMSASRENVGPLDGGTKFGDLLTSAITEKEKSSDSSNGSSEVSESASTSSIGSNSSHNRAPGAQLKHGQAPFNRQAVGGQLDYGKQLVAMDGESALGALEREQKKQNLCLSFSGMGPSVNYYNTGIENVENLVGNALDDLHLEDSLNLDLDESQGVSNSISVGLASSGLLGSSAPVNIPGASRHAFSPTTSPMIHSSFLGANHFSPSAGMDTFLNHGSGGAGSGAGGGGSGMPLSSSASKMSSYSNFFFDQPPIISPNSRNHNFSMSPSIANLELARLREEIAASRLQISSWEERLLQARAACDAWKRESEEAKRDAEEAKRAVDEAKRDADDAKRKLELTETKLVQAAQQYAVLKQDYDNFKGGAHLHSVRNVAELSQLPLSMLKNIKAQLRHDLEEVDNVLYREAASKCMVCEENNRTVTLSCNHFVLCNMCAATQDECPYCQTPINIGNNI